MARLPLLAQNADCPTVAALAQVDNPYYDFSDMVRRLSGVNTSFTPPANPPVYHVGDRETFYMPSDDSYVESRFGRFYAGGFTGKQGG